MTKEHEKHFEEYKKRYLTVIQERKRLWFGLMGWDSKIMIYGGLTAFAFLAGAYGVLGSPLWGAASQFFLFIGLLGWIKHQERVFAYITEAW